MPTTLFHATLYASLALCALGLAWRASAWFRVRVGPDTHAVTPSQRVAAALRAAAAILFGLRLFRAFSALFLDVLLLRRLYANAKLRWLGHQLILVGFTLLLLMHALAALVSEELFPGYQPTLEPYLFLRNLFGAMVLVGVCLLLSGRRRERSGLAKARAFPGAVFIVLLG